MNTPHTTTRSSTCDRGMTPSATQSVTALATAACAGPNICTACGAPLIVTLVMRTVAGLQTRFGVSTASKFPERFPLVLAVWICDTCGMQDASTLERIRRKFDALGPVMDERMRRQWAAAEAAELGWGGVSAVATATGLSRTTITAGLDELRHRAEQPEAPTPARIRRPGAG